MDVLEAIHSRHSYRGPFLETPVPREDLQKILQAGVAAPSGCNMQSTRFIGVDDPALVHSIAEAFGREWALTAPAAILLLTKPIDLPGGSRHIEDFSAAAQNILLALTGMGYAGVWIEGQIAGEPAQKMSELLKVQDDYKIAVYIPFGRPAKQPSMVRKLPFEERAWFNGYKGETK